MKWIAFLALFLAASISAADELVLKDGRVLAWKTMTDDGDAYDITTPQGTKISVKKIDVESFSIKKVEEILTGASFSFEKKKMDVVNLLARINPKQDAVAGNWSASANGLQGNCSGVTGRIRLSITPPEEYDLTLVATRKEGMDELGVGLIGGGSQFEILFDANKSTRSGIYMIDGKGADKNGTAVEGGIFPVNKPRTLNFMVRKEGVVVQLDGKDFLSWKATAWSRVSVFPDHAIPEKNLLFLQCFNSSFSVSQLKLSSPKQ